MQVSEVRLQVAAVADDVVHLSKEVDDRASIGDVRRLSEEVSRLKESERRAESAEKKAMEVERVLREEIQSKRLGTEGNVVGRDFVYNSAKPLEGVIAHLTLLGNRNVHENVEVTASSCLAESLPVTSVVELETRSQFCSDNRRNSWIRYDFKERRLTPTSYSITSHDGPSFPKSWVLEVSNEGREGSWKVVDRRNDNFSLRGPFVTHNFEISNPPRESFRYDRLRQTDKNHAGQDILGLSSFEVFGRLFSK